MSDIHIDEFHQDVAKLLTQLYSVFPKSIEIYVDDISGPDSPDEFGLASSRSQACLAAMMWLADEGYIRYGELIRNQGMDLATLSLKSYIMLTQTSSHLFIKKHSPKEKSLPPSVTEQRRSNIYLLRTALKKQSSIDISEITNYLLNI